MNQPILLVLDTETTGLKPGYHEICEIATVAYDENLDEIPVEEGGRFESLMRPLHPERASAQALAANGLTLEELEKAPHPAAVWPEYVRWVQKWNPKKGVQMLPIAGGKNIQFDFGFISAANELHLKKKGPVSLFNSREVIELEAIIRHWFWHDKNLTKMNMDYLREYFGMNPHGHRAMQDVLQTGFLITYFMKLTRQLSQTRSVDGNPIFNFHAAFRGR